METPAPVPLTLRETMPDGSFRYITAHWANGPTWHSVPPFNPDGRNHYGLQFAVGTRAQLTRIRDVEYQQRLSGEVRREMMPRGSTIRDYLDTHPTVIEIVECPTGSVECYPSAPPPPLGFVTMSRVFATQAEALDAIFEQMRSGVGHTTRPLLPIEQSQRTFHGQETTVDVVPVPSLFFNAANSNYSWVRSSGQVLRDLMTRARTREDYDFLLAILLEQNHIVAPSCPV